MIIASATACDNGWGMIRLVSERLCTAGGSRIRHGRRQHMILLALLLLLLLPPPALTPPHVYCLTLFDETNFFKCFWLDRYLAKVPQAYFYPS